MDGISNSASSRWTSGTKLLQIIIIIIIIIIINIKNLTIVNIVWAVKLDGNESCLCWTVIQFFFFGFFH
jgi:hypothetical protein